MLWIYDDHIFFGYLDIGIIFAVIVRENYVPFFVNGVVCHNHADRAFMHAVAGVFALFVHDHNLVVLFEYAFFERVFSFDIVDSAFKLSDSIFRQRIRNFLQIIAVERCD